MGILLLMCLLAEGGSRAIADSDFFQSSSVPSDLIAGSQPKDKGETATTATAEESKPANSPSVTRPGSKTAPKTDEGARKKDMPREVFVDWIGGDDEVESAEGTGSGQPRKPSSGSLGEAQSPKRGASGTRDIDELLEKEFKKTDDKDEDEDAEKRFIQVN